LDGCIQGFKKFSVGKLRDGKHFFTRGETFTKEFKLFCSMGSTRKIMIGVGLASGALLATWLLTGSRKEKTKEFVSKKAEDLKKVFKTDKNSFDDNEAHYV
jgi:hypothetical protein